jgi:hypothetical protein
LQIHVANDTSIDQFHAAIVGRTVLIGLDGHLSTWIRLSSAIGRLFAYSSATQEAGRALASPLTIVLNTTDGVSLGKHSERLQLAVHSRPWTLDEYYCGAVQWQREIGSTVSSSVD